LTAEPFSVRVSPRARHVRLVMTAGGELVVVVPRRFDQRRIPAIVQTKLPWIARARVRVQTRAAALAAQGPPLLPDRIVLPAVGEEWWVEYRPARGTRAGAREAQAGEHEPPGGLLVVTAPPDDDEAARRALIAWLRRRALRELPTRLDELAGECGLSYDQVTIRHQRSRWGSCSPRGVISLNLRLLFLEPALVDHVLLHELCHLKELNHSQRFWALLRSRDPQCAEHRRGTREGWRSMPRWLQGPGPGSPSALP
jgi:predicted metal-dependent hydrolase